MFERLTRKIGEKWVATYGTQKVTDRLAAYEDSGLSPEEVQSLAQAKAEGRLVVLPCKVGSDLWSIERARTKCTAHGEEYSEYSCQGCEEPCDSVITQKIRRVKEASHMTIAHFMQSGCFGKTVFLTREEAEKALEPEKHTLNEWAAIDGIEILDPDGFDRKDPHLFERLFTREEFNQGIINCTVKALGGGEG